MGDDANESRRKKKKLKPGSRRLKSRPASWVNNSRGAAVMAVGREKEKRSKALRNSKAKAWEQPMASKCPWAVELV